MAESDAAAEAAAERAQESETIRSLVARVGAIEDNSLVQGGILGQILSSINGLGLVEASHDASAVDDCMAAFRSAAHDPQLPAVTPDTSFKRFWNVDR